MDFKEFMLPEVKEKNEEVITFKGVETFKDKNGEPIPLKFRVIPKKERTGYIKDFTTRKPAFDEDGKNIITGNRIVIDEEVDGDSLNDYIITKSMIYPDMYDKELQDFYGVYSAVDLLNAMFKGKDYDYVDSCCSQALGIRKLDEKEIIKELKN